MAERTIKVAVPITGEEEIAAIREVIFSGNFVSGRVVEQFERAFAAYVGVGGAAAVNNGTAALHVALAALGIGAGDEVIVPPLTFMSTVTAVLHQNATPIFADVDADSFCLSAQDVERRVTERTRAVIPVHLYGNSADMDGIMKVAEAHGLHVVEDCAQAHGTEYRGRRVGGIGHLGVFSFFATKHMTTGEGGVIVSDNKAWIDTARIIRSHGLVNRDDHVCLGYNYRMTEIAGAMGLVQLEKLERLNARRIENSLYLLRELGRDGRPWFSTPALDPRVRHTFFWCPLVINPERGVKTDDVVARLRQRGIEVRHRYQAPLYRQPLFRGGEEHVGAAAEAWRRGRALPDYGSLYLPNAERLAGNIIGLPNHPALTRDDLDYVVRAVRDLY